MYKSKMEIKCGNRHPFTVHKFNKHIPYTVASKTGNAKLLFCVGNVFFQLPKMLHTKCNSLKVRDFTVLNILSPQVF